MKQFTVAHDHCAMRVNTDGCLLGALAGEDEKLNKVQHILDIGTGSGVIALQMAQRFENAFVDAVEIHGPSAKQAAQNFIASPWSNRMICYHEPLQEFESGSGYDLIISNPPFFENGPTKSDNGVANARHTLTLDFNSLIEHTSRLLNDSGSFWCILPAERAENMIDIALEEHMYPSHIYYIRPKKNREANRLILKFIKERKVETEKKELILYDSTQHYSEAAKGLLAPFYKSL
jgi:tRNA1Val (adenine37-N6)-methyltransferase